MDCSAGGPKLRSRSANFLLQGFSVFMKGQVDVREPEGQPDQSHNQQPDGEQNQSRFQQQHRVSDEPKQVSSSLNRRALGRVQRIRKRERIEVESRIDQGEDRHSDHNQGGLEKNRVNLRLLHEDLPDPVKLLVEIVHDARLEIGLERLDLAAREVDGDDDGRDDRNRLDEGEELGETEVGHWRPDGKRASSRLRRPNNLFDGDAISPGVALRPGPHLATEFPGLEALLFGVTGLHIGPTDEAEAGFIEERATGYRRAYALETLKDEPRLRAYRDFFWRVGVDPTKVRPAAEALLRRVIQGKPFPRINAPVDAYNLASAETRIALAAFDIANLGGDLRMRRSRPGEIFLGIGMEAPVTLTGVEVVCEDADRLVAIYPYRDADASKVTSDTRDVRFLVCGVPGISHEALREAAAVAANTVMRFCGGTTDGPW